MKVNTEMEQNLLPLKIVLLHVRLVIRVCFCLQLCPRFFHKFHKPNQHNAIKYASLHVNFFT